MFGVLLVDSPFSFVFRWTRVFYFFVFFHFFTESTNHECAAKRTGRTARYQPIMSVQQSAQAEQHVISQS
jgi:hypothetical protein